MLETDGNDVLLASDQLCTSILSELNTKYPSFSLMDSVIRRKYVECEWLKRKYRECLVFKASAHQKSEQLEKLTLDHEALQTHYQNELANKTVLIDLNKTLRANNEQLQLKYVELMNDMTEITRAFTTFKTWVHDLEVEMSEQKQKELAGMKERKKLQKELYKASVVNKSNHLVAHNYRNGQIMASPASRSMSMQNYIGKQNSRSASVTNVTSNSLQRSGPLTSSVSGTIHKTAKAIDSRNSLDHTSQKLMAVLCTIQDMAKENTNKKNT